MLNKDNEVDRKIGFALGGGAVFGYAHIGVLKAIDEYHIPISFISGTSVGSLVGALYAFGKTWEEILELAQNLEPASLEFSEISFSSTYFQAGFVRIKVTAWQVNLYAQSRELFEVPIGVYMPHISLVYGVPDFTQREEISNSISISSTGFIADQFQLFSYVPTNTDPASWTELQRFQFGKK